MPSLKKVYFFVCVSDGGNQMSSLELTDEYFYYEQKLGFSCVPKGILFVCVSSRRLGFYFGILWGNHEKHTDVQVERERQVYRRATIWATFLKTALAKWRSQTVAPHVWERDESFTYRRRRRRGSRHFGTYPLPFFHHGGNLFDQQFFFFFEKEIKQTSLKRKCVCDLRAS